MRQRKLSFSELVNQNKQELINDRQAMDKIEKQIEWKREKNNNKKLKR
ncbi:FbpB family small basic protein [Sediminibacillus albus]|uniref:Fur-regulated basic protein B n=1 Tax=Sediminibacillus albus TaxID=407036 RepID=A0A1G8WC97_9BACI|nr:Fur-regulated basic protein B [Sediminibacillus albus]